MLYIILTTKRCLKPNNRLKDIIKIVKQIYYSNSLYLRNEVYKSIHFLSYDY